MGRSVIFIHFQVANPVASAQATLLDGGFSAVSGVLELQFLQGDGGDVVQEKPCISSKKKRQFNT